jgi:Protein of unknown function with HXXEE motif
LFDSNFAFMIILLTLVHANFRKSTPLRGVLLAAFASANLFWDTLFHLVMTPILDRYSPGVVTAMRLYYPICLLARPRRRACRPLRSRWCWITATHATSKAS